ncbi:MAG: glycerol kinase GlpK, partial [Actinomycetota bacterium]|nr:glycerol kinase GlpK [Actinomycetota bacterium]
MGDFVLAIDQGTTSTRAVVVDHAGTIRSQGQLEHRQHLPRAGWVEHDPIEIWDRTREVIARALARADLTHRDLAAVGITNQRETTIVWERRTGQPVHPAIVWQDVRTQDAVERLGADDGVREAFTSRTGLPLATYFAGPKIRWILDHVDGARAAAERGELAFGTVDTWLLWNATGGPDGGVHLTDVTNASRTLLMDLATLDWDPDLAAALGVPLAMLPEIRPSSGELARAHRATLVEGVPITGMLGDQHAATFGQACFSPGQAKNTYGTGNFMLLNTGPTAVRSQHGLLTTVAYQLAGEAPVFALEGSIAVTGSLVQWLRDNLGLIDSASDIEALAASVTDAGGAVVVPAFSGLFAPHWRPDARGAIVGLTRYVTKAHLARAALEA